MRKILLSLAVALLPTMAFATATPTATATSTPTPSPTVTSTATPSPVATTVLGAIMATNQQLTDAQTINLPNKNALRCARWGLPPTCATADVINAGCVSQPFYNVTTNNLIYTDCLIYSLDMTPTGLPAYWRYLIYRDWLQDYYYRVATDQYNACVALNESPGTCPKPGSNTGRNSE